MNKLERKLVFNQSLKNKIKIFRKESTSSNNSSSSEKLFNDASNNFSFNPKLIFMCTSTLLDDKIFLEHTSSFKEQFQLQMEMLHVLPPTVATVTSNYLQEIIKYITHIIEKGYGYVIDCSVYFNICKFYEERVYRELLGEKDLFVELSEQVQKLTTTISTNEKKNSDDILL